jgi:hypothetical protein
LKKIGKVESEEDELEFEDAPKNLSLKNFIVSNKKQSFEEKFGSGRSS